MVISAIRRSRDWARAHPTLVTVAGSLVVLAALVAGLWGKREDFGHAITNTSPMLLAAAVVLQVVWLIARSEAWHVCVGAAGGQVHRRRLYRAAGVGYLGNVFNPNFGLAVRIAVLRKTAPEDSPKPSVLLAAEMPIVVIEVALAALMSFTMISALGAPWWAPVIAVSVTAFAIFSVSFFARNRREGIWRGAEVLRGLRSRNAIVGLVIFAVVAQVVRNWLMLHGVGVDISIFSAVALLIGTAAFGLLPLGPGLSAATAVVILGSNGVALVAAAGALLTVTGAVGAILFAAWVLADGLRSRRSLTEPY